MNTLSIAPNAPGRESLRGELIEGTAVGASEAAEPHLKDGAIYRPHLPTRRGTRTTREDCSAEGSEAPKPEFEDGSVYRIRWWASVDSNHGPQSYQDCALTV